MAYRFGATLDHVLVWYRCIVTFSCSMVVIALHLNMTFFQLFNRLFFFQIQFETTNVSERTFWLQQDLRLMHFELIKLLSTFQFVQQICRRFFFLSGRRHSGWSCQISCLDLLFVRQHCQLSWFHYFITIVVYVTWLSPTERQEFDDNFITESRKKDIHRDTMILGSCSGKCLVRQAWLR